ncbi:hypothetical protein [Legionella sp.]|uniref:hypothetical protein n=1 Tax=Legionella sp. TaxID=459 RepID=UPI003CB27228
MNVKAHKNFLAFNGGGLLGGGASFLTKYQELAMQLHLPFDTLLAIDNSLFPPKEFYDYLEKTPKHSLSGVTAKIGCKSTSKCFS